MGSRTQVEGATRASRTVQVGWGGGSEWTRNRCFGFFSSLRDRTEDLPQLLRSRGLGACRFGQTDAKLVDASAIYSQRHIQTECGGGILPDEANQSAGEHTETQ